MNNSFRSVKLINHFLKIPLTFKSYIYIYITNNFAHIIIFIVKHRLSYLQNFNYPKIILLINVFHKYNSEYNI